MPLLTLPLATPPATTAAAGAAVALANAGTAAGAPEALYSPKSLIKFAEGKKPSGVFSDDLVCVCEV